MAYLLTSRGSGRIEAPSVSEVLSTSIERRKSKRSKEDIKTVVDQIKNMLKREKDPEWIHALAASGILLNALLVKQNG